MTSLGDYNTTKGVLGKDNPLKSKIGSPMLIQPVTIVNKKVRKCPEQPKGKFQINH